MRWVAYRRLWPAFLNLGLVGQASACPLEFIECDFVRKPRSEGLRLSNGAQARVPVPLKEKVKDAGRRPAVRKATRKKDTASGRALFFYSRSY